MFCVVSFCCLNQQQHNHWTCLLAFFKWKTCKIRYKNTLLFLMYISIWSIWVSWWSWHWLHKWDHTRVIMSSKSNQANTELLQWILAFFPPSLGSRASPLRTLTEFTLKMTSRRNQNGYTWHKIHKRSMSVHKRSTLSFYTVFSRVSFNAVVYFVLKIRLFEAIVDNCIK